MKSNEKSLNFRRRPDITVVKLLDKTNDSIQTDAVWETSFKKFFSENDGILIL